MFAACVAVRAGAAVEFLVLRGLRLAGGRARLVDAAHHAGTIIGVQGERLNLPAPIPGVKTYLEEGPGPRPGMEKRVGRGSTNTSQSRRSPRTAGTTPSERTRKAEAGKSAWRCDGRLPERTPLCPVTPQAAVSWPRSSCRTMAPGIAVETPRTDPADPGSALKLNPVPKSCSPG